MIVESFYRAFPFSCHAQIVRAAPISSLIQSFAFKVATPSQVCVLSCQYASLFHVLLDLQLQKLLLAVMSIERDDLSFSLRSAQESMTVFIITG